MCEQCHSCKELEELRNEVRVLTEKMDEAQARVFASALGINWDQIKSNALKRRARKGFQVINQGADLADEGDLKGDEPIAFTTELNDFFGGNTGDKEIGDRPS